MGLNADAALPAPRMTTDSDVFLMRQYVRHGSQAAFGALVRRYGGLVHATCLREVDDPALAEDAAQVVFLLLARRAPSLLRLDSLAGWLQDTPASHFLFSPPPGMALTWTFGPRTVWHGMKVRELQAHISNQGHVGVMSLFLDPSGTLLLGHEGETTDGKPGYALFLGQKENPPLPATLGNAP